VYADRRVLREEKKNDLSTGRRQENQGHRWEEEKNHLGGRCFERIGRKNVILGFTRTRYGKNANFLKKTGGNKKGDQRSRNAHDTT